MKKSQPTSERSNVCRKVGDEGLRDLGEVEHLFCAILIRVVRPLRGRVGLLRHPFYKRLTSPRSPSRQAYSVDFQYLLIDIYSYPAISNVKHLRGLDISPSV